MVSFISINNSKFVDYVDCICPNNPEIKDKVRSASYHDLQLNIDRS
jgi:hypothetical protein